MPYGHLNVAQLFALQPHIEGKEVHDLGCGDMALSRALVVLGAARVVAIDRREGRRFKPVKDDRVRIVNEYFHDFHEPVETAFVSWPPQHYITGLDTILKGARTVAYLGTNFDGTVCGPREMWALLVRREVLAHVPERRNTLIVYGPNEAARDLLPEEHAAIHDYKIWPYKEPTRQRPRRKTDARIR